MNIQMLADFFMGCTLLNAGLLVLSFLVLAFAGDFVYALHSRWFPMPRPAFNALLYGLLGLYKIFIFVFNLVPWIVLSMLG